MTPAQAAAPTASRRERARAATIEEIQATARSLMRERGTVDVGFTDIARVMGMTAPALYRYYADRDELLTDLIAGTYDDVAAVVAAARDAVSLDDIPGRILASLSAYRRWALAHPEELALMFGLPVPGYAAREDGPTDQAADRALAELGRMFVEARSAGLLGAPLVTELEPALVGKFHVRHPQLAQVVDAMTFQAMTQMWASLHGFVSLEAYGQFHYFDDEEREACWRGHVRLICRAAGLPDVVGAAS